MNTKTATVSWELIINTQERLGKSKELQSSISNHHSYSRMDYIVGATLLDRFLSVIMYIVSTLNILYTLKMPSYYNINSLTPSYLIMNVPSRSAEKM